MRPLRPLALVLPALLLVSIEAAAIPKFPSSFQTIDVGLGYFEPTSAALADLDGDSRGELVAVSDLDPRVKTFRLDSNGRWNVVASLSTGANPRYVRLADFDADGTLDLALAGPDVWGTAHGIGDGSFGPVARLALYGGGARGLEVADVDADGDVDVLVWNDGGQILVRANRGDGSMDSVTTASVGAVTAVAVADVVGDPRPEILAATSSGVVAISSVAVDGGLAVLGTIGPGGQRIVAADFDHDGRMDVASGSFLYRGSVSGLVPSGSSGMDVRAVADVDDDGNADLLGVYLNRLVVGAGRGDGSFDATVEFPAGKAPVVIATGDLEGDGKTDVLVTHYQANRAGLYPQTPEGLFESSMSFTTPVFSKQVLAEDVNTDGHVDALVLGIDGAVRMFVGDGHGVLGAAQSFALGGPVSRAVLADLNGDGRMDFAASRTTPARLVVRLADAQGGFAPAVAYVASGLPSWIISGDVDGNGTIDLVTTDLDGRRDAFLNPGNGSFGPGVSSLSPYWDYAFSYRQSSLADVNGDGILDLVATIVGPTPGLASAVQFCEGSGTGSFSYFPAPIFRGSVSAGHAVLPCRIGSVGEQAFVVVEEDSAGFVYGRMHLDRAVCCAPAPEFVPALTSDVFGADFDEDGSMEVVLATTKSNVLDLWSVDSEGALTHLQNVAVDDSPISVAAADLNEDGRLDLVVVHSKSATILVVPDVSPDGPPQLATAKPPLVGPDQISILWKADNYPGAWARVARRDAKGLWSVGAPARFEANGRLTTHDLAVAAGASYTYRLLLRTPSAERIAAEITAGAPSDGSLDAPAPRIVPLRIASPSHGTTIALGLAGFAAAPVEVTLHSVTGRVVGRWTVNGGGGVQLARPLSLPPGVYLVRTEQAAHVATGRVVLL